MADPILIAKSKRELSLLPHMSNRHGLIAGATGTGKTVTLQMMAEGFSRIGVPVFMADVKGDLAGMSQSGGENPKVAERARQLGVELAPLAMPVVFWDIFGEQGHPVRSTVSEMGPLLLARMLNLNETQEGVLATVFKIALSCARRAAAWGRLRGRNGNRSSLFEFPIEGASSHCYSDIGIHSSDITRGSDAHHCY